MSEPPPPKHAVGEDARYVYKQEPAVPWHQKHASSMSLEVHLRETRQRTAGMTPEERAWRKRWVLAQKLDDTEPLDHELRTMNPLRKLVRFPWDTIEQRFLAPKMGWYWAKYTRYFIPRTFFAMTFSWYVWYNLKYQRTTWESYRGWRFFNFGPHGIHNAEEIEAENPGIFALGWGTHEPNDKETFAAYGNRDWIKDNMPVLDAPERP